MKKLSYSQKLVAVLKVAKIPANVIALILTLGKNNLTEIVHSANVAALCELPGVAEKRSTVIIAALKKAMMNARFSSKAEKREKAPGYSCRSYTKEELWREVLDMAIAISQYKPVEDEDPAIRIRYQKMLRDLDRKLFGLNLKKAKRTKKEHVASKNKKTTFKLMNRKGMQLTVREKAGRIIRLNKSAISEVCKVDYESKKPISQLAIIEYGVQEVFNFHPTLFNNDYEVGVEKRDEYQKKLMRKVVGKGTKVLPKDTAKKPDMFGLIASSPAHQKGEKGMIVKASILKTNEDFFWFGKSLNVFATETHQTGAERLKGMANMLRPWMKPFVTKNGHIIRMKDILFVDDVEKTYIIKNARRIGKLNGGLVRNGLDKELKVILDGGIMFLEEMEFQGQASSAGLKGYGFDGSSPVMALCEKYGMSLEEFMNIKVKGIDGRMHRLGDYKAIAGSGCWKLDKAFSSYDEYMIWLNTQAKKHKDIDVVYLLRQSEEIEDEEKVRRLTKSLIQQWLFMTAAEIRKLTKQARNDLKKAKSFSGSVKKLAALWKNPEERSAVEKLFNEAPWLVMNPCIQNYLEESWNRKLIEAASCKFRTFGQYPYIMQDPVAALEVWVLGKNPDDPDLGILKGDEVSVADVEDGKELLCVRFPANFLTAMVMKNKACRKEFASMNGVMVISIHSDILIRQDGDVDGDEMCVIYDKLAIDLTKRMIEKYNPPVVLFQHGSKGDKPTYQNAKEFLDGVADALWMAKRYDSVGIYANLAMKCAYIASVYEARGDVKRRDEALLWMSVASTGAIIAIDQVKGNAIDESLINWLNDIQKYVRKAFKEIAAEMGYNKAEQSKRQAPFTHFYNEMAKRRPISIDVCLPANDDNFVDQISSLILHDAGTWAEYDAQNVVWNKDAAIEALLDHSMPFGMKVRYGVVTQQIIDTLGDNWFKFAAKAGEIDATVDTRRKLRVGSQLGMKEFMLLLWRNESSMSYSMEGRTLWEKKEEYYGTCRDLIKMFLESGNWVNQYAKSFPVGYEFKPEERWTIAANAIVSDALELAGSNGVDKKGSYAMFCLKVFAEDIVKNLKENRVGNARFLLSDDFMEEIAADLDFEAAQETLELFEAVPVQEEQPEEPQEEPQMDDGYLEYLMSQMPPEEDECVGGINW